MTIFFFHIQILWMVPHVQYMIHFWLEVTVSGDYWLENTIHMDTIHSVIALAPASYTTPSFYLSQRITLCWVTERSIILCLANAQNTVLCTLFYMNTANKDKGKLFLCSWRWHVQGGTALHEFLNVASDVGEWSDMLQPPFPSDKELLVPLNVRSVWPLNQSECFVEVKNLLNLQ